MCVIFLFVLKKPFAILSKYSDLTVSNQQNYLHRTLIFFYFASVSNMTYQFITY